MNRTPSRIFSPLARSSSICRSCQWSIQRRSSSFISQVSKAVREVAEKDNQPEPEEYRPATTWEGLEWIGTKQWVLEQKKQDYLDGLEAEKLEELSSPFAFFDVPEEALEASLEVALVEVLLCDSLNLGLERVDGISPLDFPHDGIELGAISRPGSEEFDPIVICRSEQDRSLLLQCFNGSKETSAISPKNVKVESEVDKGQVQSWKRLRLDSPEIRFALLKRILQRTGRRIPDSELDLCVSPGVMLRLLRKPRKPVKLAKIIEQDARFNLPNVQTYAVKQKAINKDISIGRWKVIREELKKRGLPEFKHRVIKEHNLPTDNKAKKF